jgi:anthranilate 1,2-dioxygenase large subunit
MGGMCADFDKRQHGLTKLRVATYRGVVFGTFAAECESLEDYLGPMIRGHLDTLMQRPVQILGYQRQRVYGNWKAYSENLRDTYHASLLHEFLSSFGLDRATQRGGVEMDERHRHNITYTAMGTDADEEAYKLYQKENLVKSTRLQLNDASMLKYKPEFSDGRSMATSSLFPGIAFARFMNTMATRHIHPKGTDAFVLVWTCFGYADDDDEMREHRLNQMNLLGPGGYVSMEDSEAIEIVHRGTQAALDDNAVLEVGGKGPIVDCAFRVTDVSVRGFWSYYAEVMGIEPPGAVR